jgi:hypothetical protein
MQMKIATTLGLVLLAATFTNNPAEAGELGFCGYLEREPTNESKQIKLILALITATRVKYAILEEPSHELMLCVERNVGIALKSVLWVCSNQKPATLRDTAAGMELQSMVGMLAMSCTDNPSLTQE